MSNRGDRKDTSEGEATFFGYCRNLEGNLVPIGVARQNGRLVPHFPRTILEPYFLPNDPDTPDYLELVEELCQGLSNKVRRRWLLAIREGRSNLEIGQIEGVRREAVIDGFRRAARRNPYVRIWLENKNKINQHA